MMKIMLEVRNVKSSQKRLKLKFISKQFFEGTFSDLNDIKGWTQKIIEKLVKLQKNIFSKNFLKV
jgi:hypothetical protein